MMDKQCKKRCKLLKQKYFHGIFVSVVWVFLCSFATLSFTTNQAFANDQADFRAFMAQFTAKRYANRPVPAVVQEALQRLQFLPRVIELDRRQPEFSLSFYQYIDRVISEQRIMRGRELYRAGPVNYARTVTNPYGIPAHVILAFWGLETNYGTHLGEMPVLDSLATLSYDGRRRDFFSKELNIVLDMIEAGTLPASEAKGSWAGAMGHFQFMPSTYHGYARRADGKAGPVLLRRDLPDAFVSAGRYLQAMGWKAGERWGREVTLPPTFDFKLAGYRQKKQPLSFWNRQGVRRMDGSPLPAADLEARVLIPMGYQGPAFLIYDNFDVIMRWNRSLFYALGVGLLSDQIAGRPGIQAKRVSDPAPLKRAQIKDMQVRLAQLGFSPGKPDGIIGSGTRQALRQFQAQQGLVADGYPDPTTLRRLLP